MGDRANIIIELPLEYADEPKYGDVYLYTHWGGSALPKTLQESLKSSRAKARYNDEAYLARIIFCDLVAGNEKGETGFGLSLRPCDNSYPYLRVNPEKQTVTVDYDPVRQDHHHPNRTYTFKEFTAIPDISWEDLEPKVEPVTESV